MRESGEEGPIGLIISGIIQKGVIRDFNFYNFAEPKFLGLSKSFAQIEPES
jgi:hypothetical protein